MAYAKDIEESVAAVIAGTRRQARGVSLATVLYHLEVLVRALGGVGPAAAVVGLSPEMARQFLSMRNLSPDVMRLVRKRKLDSVDVAHRIAKLAPHEQKPVAEAYISGDLSSDGVRAVVSYRRSHPRAFIGGSIRAVVGSRNIKHYIVMMELPDSSKSPAALRRSISRVTGTDGIVSLDTHGRLLRLVLNANGSRRLSEKARQQRVTKRALMQDVLLRGG